MSNAQVEAADITTKGGTRVARIILVGIGGLGTLGGLFILVTTVKPNGLVGLGVWLLGALILHDGILSPVLFVAQRALHHVGKRIPGRVLAIVQGAVLLGGIITLVVVPEIFAQLKGPRNSSVLDMPYGLYLFFAWIVITVGATIIGTLVYRRQRVETGAAEDKTAAQPAQPISLAPASTVGIVITCLALPASLVLRLLRRRKASRLRN